MTEKKRAYRKGNPLSPVDRKIMHKNRHAYKELRVFIDMDLKDKFALLCLNRGIKQKDVIKKMIENFMDDRNLCE